MENFAWRSEVLPLISCARRHRRGAAARDARAPAGDPQLPGRDADGPSARVRAVRFPAARRVLAGAAVRASPRRWPRCAPRSRSCRRRRSTAFRNSFQHVFSGGYAAGYYSYKWAEVLSADAFGAFEEHGIYDVSTARRFLQAILERGGSRDAMEAFVEFRGRRPRSSHCCASSGWRPEAGNANRHLERQFAARAPAAAQGLARREPGRRDRAAGNQDPGCRFPVRRDARRRAAMRDHRPAEATTASRSWRARRSRTSSSASRLHRYASRVIAATIAGVRIVDVYVPNGQTLDSDKYPYKLLARGAAAYLVAELDGIRGSSCSATTTSRPRTATCTIRRPGRARCT